MTVFAYQQTKGMTTRIVDGEAFVISKDRIRHFNQSATAIWLILSEPTTLAELVELLCSLYPVERAQIRKDAQASLRVFQKFGIIQKIRT